MIQNEIVSCVSTKPEEIKPPMRTITRAVQIGCLLLIIGAGFFLNAWRITGSQDINIIRQVEDYDFWGTFIMSGGFGLMLGAGVTYLYYVILMFVKKYSSK